MALINLRHFIGKVAHPIGSIIMTVEAVNPESYWGGTWVQLSGVFLHGGSSTYPVTEANSNGGSANAINVAHTHPNISHTHYTNRGAGYGCCLYKVGGSTLGKRGWLTQSQSGYRYAWSATSSSYLAYDNYTSSVSISQAASGVSGTGANMPPYKAVYMWKRTGW
ncbi:MAG: hypothetical protein Q4B18_02615 [Bacillota bacterium]|nr:hypothetical protein [Bacillota bacterium]